MLALFFSAVLLAAAPQIQVPQNDGWVTDLAGILSPDQERSLESLMESYKSGTTHEIALLTVESLEGQPLERTALEVARGWGLGGADSNNGALLLVSKADRKIRIEVGRGLEGNLTDSISGRIIRDIISPQFKQGRFHEGLRAGIGAMHAAIGGDYGPVERTAAGRRSDAGSAGAGVVGMVIFMLLMIRMGRGRRRGVGGILPWILLGSLTGRRGGGGGGFSSGGLGGGGFGGFSGFGGGGGFSGGGASGGW